MSSSLKDKAWSAAVGIAVGALLTCAAVLGAGYWNLRSNPDQVSREGAEAPPGSARTHVPTSPSGELEARRTANLEARLAALEAARSGAASGADTSSPPPDAPTADELRGELEDEIRQHEQDPADPDWSAKTTQLLEQGFETAKAYLGYQGAKIDCKMTTCRAVLQWPSAQAAESGWRRALYSPLGVGCGRQILLEPQPGPGGEQQGTMILHCEDWRADGSKTVPTVALPGESPAL